MARGTHVRLAADPRHRAPLVAIRRVHLSQRRRQHFDLRILRHDEIDHLDERARIQRGLGRHFGPCNAEPLLKVLFVPHQHIDVLDDPSQNLDSALFGP